MSVVPYIGATVHFAAALDGQTIINLIRAITSNYEPDFVEARDPAHPEHVLVGQISRFSHDHLRVVDPNNVSVGLLPTEEYAQVFVVSQIWENRVVELTGDAGRLNTVKQFCADLDEAAFRTLGR